MASKKNAQSRRVVMAHPSGTWITIKQVMEITQTKSPHTVHDWINKGLLPAVKLGDRANAPIRVLVDDVYALMIPVIPPDVMADLRSRQPAGSPLHLPVDGGGE